jgi:hypothetical protein
MPPSLRDTRKCSEGKRRHFNRLKVIRSLDGNTAELFYVHTDELIAWNSGRSRKGVGASHTRSSTGSNGWPIDHVEGGKHTAADGFQRPWLARTTTRASPPDGTVDRIEGFVAEDEVGLRNESLA